MIEIFRYENKWRIKIVNETLEFETIQDFYTHLKYLLELKEKREPYNKERKNE